MAWVAPREHMGILTVSRIKCNDRTRRTRRADSAPIPRSWALVSCAAPSTAPRRTRAQPGFSPAPLHGSQSHGQRRLPKPAGEDRTSARPPSPHPEDGTSKRPIQPGREQGLQVHSWCYSFLSTGRNQVTAISNIQTANGQQQPPTPADTAG